jgi:GNAT superfamily N-acetyltransferase
MLAQPVHCRPALPDEVHPALGMILGGGGKLADDQQVAEFLAFADQRRIVISDLWIAASGGVMLWAILPIVSPGRTTLLFAPSDPPHPHIVPAAGALLDTVCNKYAANDVQLAQVLLDPADDAGRRMLEAHGFRRMAELIYLHAAVRRPLPPPELPADLAQMNYTPQTHALFANAILASYQQSLDCPALNGVRRIEDIIAGHKAGGEFDPRHWYVLCDRNKPIEETTPIGVLLLSRLPRGDSAELVYLGLAPSARGKSLGDWMMRRAFTTAASMGVARLSLAVDSINAPALKLYYRFGMAKMGSKVAMMRKLI